MSVVTLAASPSHWVLFLTTQVLSGHRSPSGVMMSGCFVEAEGRQTPRCFCEATVKPWQLSDHLRSWWEWWTSGWHMVTYLFL